MFDRPHGWCLWIDVFGVREPHPFTFGHSKSIAYDRAIEFFESIPSGARLRPARSGSRAAWLRWFRAYGYEIRPVWLSPVPVGEVTAATWGEGVDG